MGANAMHTYGFRAGSWQSHSRFVHSSVKVKFSVAAWKNAWEKCENETKSQNVRRKIVNFGNLCEFYNNDMRYARYFF